MQPNPWDDGDYSSNEVSMQDSAFAGDLHSGDTFHNHSHESRPSPILVGFPQPGNTNGHQVVYLQQHSSSPKIIGIFVIIWGAFSLLGTLPLFFLTPQNPFTGEEMIVPQAAFLIDITNALFVGLTCILSGFWMTQYKKKGIHLALLSLFISYLMGLAAVSLGADGGIGSLLDDDSAAFTLVAVVQGICSVICGLLVAIPLMSSGQGMDDSSLFGSLK